MRELKFVIDAMLGKLVKWLRIIGCDVLSVTEIGDSDEDLLNVAKSTGRTLITGDQALFQRSWRKGVKVKYIEGNDVIKALALLSKTESVPLRIDLDRTRCPDCNSKLIELPSEKVSEIPSEIRARHNWVYLCIKCNKAYWLGSHYLKMLKTLMEAKKKRDGVQII
ncbi:MAG TPA: hypothetical protein EYP68_08210 [Candidatus Korarchaeota archaeon]|nr:hypothetical protein [Candidatus Korarchaeota archaeon]